MQRRFFGLAVVCFFAGQLRLQAQEFKLFDRMVQVHGFASQGFVYTDQNNWLTMHSSQGSGAFTDFGANISTQITDKFRVGAQVYDRNLGNLGEWHPTLDWAFADYRFKTWLGVRGGKVKTVLGLYNDTQDLDFLHTFALLPQSVYPTDLRDSTIAHVGGDVYGRISLKHRLGDLAYTAYAGASQRQHLQRLRLCVGRVWRHQTALRRITVWRRSALEYSVAWTAHWGVAPERTYYRQRDV